MKKILTLILLCTALLCFSFGCDSSTNVTFNVSDVVNCKINELTDEKLLSLVEVFKEDGSKVTATLDKGNADYSKVGEYEVTFKYKGAEKTVKLRVFDMPKLYYNGTELTENTVMLNYGQAKNSYDFVSGISVKDSFGTQLDVTKAGGSDSFDYEKDNFNVTYEATDAAGNKLSKTIAYTLSTEFNPVVENKEFYIQDDEDIELTIDLKGETDFLLYKGADIVPSNLYSFNEGKLHISKDLFGSLVIGENKLRVETLKGKGIFTLNIQDNGKPFFTLGDSNQVFFTEAPEITVGLPNVVIEGSEYDWTYTLTDRDNDSNSCSVTKTDVGLVLLNSAGESIKCGRYYLDVKAMNANGDLTKRLDVRVFDGYYWSANPDGAIVEYAVDPDDDSNVIRAYSFSWFSTDNALYFTAEQMANVETVSFDFKYTLYTDVYGANVSTPKLIYTYGDIDDPDKFLQADYRLTPRSGIGYLGQEMVIDLQSGEEVVWDADWQINHWYRITLSTKDIEDQLVQFAYNHSSISYEFYYKNFNFTKYDLVWDNAINATIKHTTYNDENVISVTTTEEAETKGSYISIPTERLAGVTTVTFDVMLRSGTDCNYLDSADFVPLTMPKMIYYHSNAIDPEVSNYGSFWDNKIRLTDRNGNTGYETIVKTADGSPISWDATFELNTWYTITLKVKSNSVPLAQVVNNGSCCTYELLYKNFVFDTADTIWDGSIYADITSDIVDGERVTRVKTIDDLAFGKGSYIYMSEDRLEGIATVSFDVMVKNLTAQSGDPVSTPMFIFYQAVAGEPGTVNYGAYWTVDIRLTPKNQGTNEGYEVITNADGDEVWWQDEWETDAWYTVTLTLKTTDVQLSQVVYNGNACTYELLYKNFVFTPVAE